MQTRTDAELLRDYAEGQSEDAFGELVRRYADFVYSAALRQVNDAERARDVAQMVFADLARKAGSLRPGTVLIGWLCHAARLAALHQLRREQRRTQRERHAMDWFDSSPGAASEWNSIQPLLDEALASLGGSDRDALLLRFFKNESLASIGATLGVSEDAAQKRVSRALNKLKEFLSARGVHTSSATLAAALAAGGVIASPPGLAAALAASALSATTTSTIPLSHWILMNMKTALVALAAMAGIAALAVVQTETKRQLRLAQSQLQEQALELSKLRAEQNQWVSQSNELRDLRARAHDALRLRNEIAQLRTQNPSSPGSADAAAVETNSPSTKAQVHVKAMFAVTSRSNLKQISGAWMPAGAGSQTAVLSQAHFKNVSQALASASDASVVTSGQIITFNDNEASMFVGQMVPFSGSNAPSGLNLQIRPSVSEGPWIRLGFVARLTALVDHSQSRDGSDQHFHQAESAATVSVPEGQTIVLEQDLSNDDLLARSFAGSVAGPKTLLVFLTPRVLTGSPSEPPFAPTSNVQPLQRDDSAVPAAVRSVQANPSRL